jgi:hypothetical protein
MMMTIRDPKIIRPGSEAEAAAVRAFSQEQSMKHNPLYPRIQALEEQFKLLVQQNRALTSRYHALMDYLSSIGLFVAQHMDSEGYVVAEETFTLSEYPPLFEGLVEKGVLKAMPSYSLEAYLAEHLRMGEMLIQFSYGINRGLSTMKDVIETVRAYNADPRRIIPIKGTHFQLDAYLAANPDSLSDEELDALAAEFGLYRVEEEEPNANEGEAQETTEGVSVEGDSPAS